MDIVASDIDIPEPSNLKIPEIESYCSFGTTAVSRILGTKDE